MSVDNLRALLAKATERPWASRKNHGPDQFAPKGYRIVAFSRKRDESYTTSDLLPADADLIAAAVNNLPALLNAFDVLEDWVSQDDPDCQCGGCLAVDLLNGTSA